jgi:hypothetical protein
MLVIKIVPICGALSGIRLKIRRWLYDDSHGPVSFSGLTRLQRQPELLKDSVNVMLKR